MFASVPRLRRFARHPFIADVTPPKRVSLRTKQATKLRPKQHLVLFQSRLFSDRPMPIPVTPKRIENLFIDLQDVDSSIPTPIRSAISLEEEVRIAVQESGKSLRISVPAAEISPVETEGLEICSGSEGHEGAVVDGLFIPSGA
jgi:hypothetical protein